MSNPFDEAMTTDSIISLKKNKLTELHHCIGLLEHSIKSDQADLHLLKIKSETLNREILEIEEKQHDINKIAV